MNIEYLGGQNNKPIAVIINDFYSNDELNLIWQELDFLTYKNKLLPAEKTAAAKEMSGEIKKKNSALFLDKVYYMREVSNILSVNRKLFNLAEELEEKNILFRSLRHCTVDSTLLNYYEDSDYYEPHCDAAVLTALTFFHKEPKQFSGGDLILNDFDITIEIKNNMLVIIPSIYKHQATPVKMKDSNFSGYGRYSMAQFVTYA